MLDTKGIYKMIFLQYSKLNVMTTLPDSYIGKEFYLDVLDNESNYV